MARFSANLGFLWQELPLPDAIRAAKAAGFDAVECHWPYGVPAVEVRSALDETGLVMLGLNTSRGDPSAGDNGLCALPDRKVEARNSIRQALDYAVAIGTPNIHVMAGRAQGDAARETFIENLRHACDLAAGEGKTILIEPLNNRDAPGYFLNGSDQACAIIETVGAANLKLMFDCYHLQIMEGDLIRRLERLMPVIGHIQIASVPGRAEPDDGEVDYRYLLKTLDSWGYAQPIGAEYRPRQATDAGLGWTRVLR